MERNAHKPRQGEPLGEDHAVTLHEHDPRVRWLGLALLLALIAFGAFVRIDTALADRNFDRVHAQGMLKSDPGLGPVIDKVKAARRSARGRK